MTDYALYHAAGKSAASLHSGVQSLEYAPVGCTDL